MTKEFLTSIIELLMLLEDDQQHAVTGIFSDETIEKMNKIREMVLEELTK